jgi:chloramphenicol-sensitive protein RarD
MLQRNELARYRFLIYTRGNENKIWTYPMATDTVPTATKNEDTPRGFGFALSAYLLWGFLPLYMKAVGHIPATEVLAHRVVWSLPVAGLVLFAVGGGAEIKAALRSPRTLMMAAVTAMFITINWTTYIWAISVGRALDTALGYFINPLFSIFLAAVLLKERLSPLQLVAIALVLVAVAIITVDAGGVPWVALVLTVTWGFYAFFRKTLPVGPNQGFFLEVLILALPCLLYIVYLEANGQGHLMQTGISDGLLLAASGFVTAVPLILYANGAKLLRLSTISLMQYVAPTMIFLIAIFVFHEPLNTTRLAAFGLIWAALLVYSWPMIRQARKR